MLHILEVEFETSTTKELRIISWPAQGQALGAARSLSQAPAPGPRTQAPVLPPAPAPAQAQPSRD